MAVVQQGQQHVLGRSQPGQQVVRLKDKTDLAISHTGSWLPPSTLLELDIVLPGGEAYLRHLPGTTVSDFEMNGTTIRDITVRRCGIQFENLTDSEKSCVNSLIQHHTEETEA